MVTIALVGSGYWGKNIARSLHELGALYAICDANQDVGSAMAARFNVPFFGAVDDVLKRDDIDALAIATPAKTHFSLAWQALNAGKDAYVEKPIALDVRDAEELAKCADSNSRILMVGHLLQYHPVFLRMKHLVRQGAVGRLLHVYSNRLNFGKLRREENVLWSFAPHDISMILALADEMPSHVVALGHNYLHPSVADTTVTHLKFASGLNGHIYVSWLHPFKEQKLIVVGETGMLVFDDIKPWTEKLAHYQHRVEWRDGVPSTANADRQFIAVDECEPLKEELTHFLTCVADRTLPRTDAAEGIAVLRVLNAADESMRMNQAVTLGSDATAPKGDDSYFAHETVAIDDGAEIGSGTRIWHFSHILGNSRIGANCSIGQNVSIGPDVTIGSDCKIQNNVSVYKGVTLEDNVFCGPSMVFTNVITPRAHVERKDEFAPTLVKRGASIGANATVICGRTIGAYAMIGAGAVVTKDVLDHALVVGNPARQIGWVSATGERLGPDLVCPRTGVQYRQTPAGLAEIAMQPA